MIRSAVGLCVLLFAALAVPAQTTSTPSTPPPPVTKVIEDCKVIDKDGNSIQVLGKVKITYDGKMKAHPELPNTFVIEGNLQSWIVHGKVGGATSVTAKGPLKGECEKASVAINTEGDGAKVEVSGDNCKLVCSGTNTSVTITPSAQGTGISAMPNSSGAIANQGVGTSLTVAAGSGGWSMK